MQTRATQETRATRETAIVYPNRHVRITSNLQLNNQRDKQGRAVYINYGGLKYLLSNGTQIKFVSAKTQEDITELMLRKIEVTAQLVEIKREFEPKFKMETDNSDDYDPFASRSRIKG